MFNPRSKCSLTLVEFLIVLCIILALIGTLALYLHRTLKVAQETALIAELYNIRISLEYYRIINKKWPEDLSVLVNKNLTIKQLSGNLSRLVLFKPYRVDKEGYLLDPFMSKYDYNRFTGKVKSQTRGYGNW